MKYLNKLLENNDLNEDIKEEAIQLYLETKAKLPGMVVLDEDAELMLSNHILALIKRIKEQMFVEPIDEEMMSEVSDEAFQKADELVGWIFEGEKIPKNRSEIFLVATHVEMALQKMKEEK